MKDETVFSDTKLSDILEEIHRTSGKKRKELTAMIDKMLRYITNVDDAVVIAPIIKELYEVSVKNDDQIVKLSQIVQRLLVAETKNESNDRGLLSEQEKLQLLNNVNDKINSIREIDKEINTSKDQLQDTVKKYQ